MVRAPLIVVPKDMLSIAMDVEAQLQIAAVGVSVCRRVGVMTTRQPRMLELRSCVSFCCLRLRLLWRLLLYTSDCVA
jgi:hypothetical protein